MNRREVIVRLLAGAGVVAIAGPVFLTGCHTRVADRSVPFTTDERALMDEISETIVPRTDTPGARQAGVGAFLATSAVLWFDDPSFMAFRQGLATIDATARKRHSAPFVSATSAQRTAILNELDAEQRAARKAARPGEPQHFFRQMKNLVLIGYFSSEVGCTKALRYVETPGAYRGDDAYKPGDRAYYNPSRRLG